MPPALHCMCSCIAVWMLPQFPDIARGQLLTGRTSGKLEVGPDLSTYSLWTCHCQ